MTSLVRSLIRPVRWGDRLSRALQVLGNWLQLRQDAIRCLQWAVVAIYYVLLIVPAIFPPGSGAGSLEQLAVWAEVLFWAVWWPGVLVFTLLFGQFWCGVFCPDGTVTEFASRRGLGSKIPGWVRKPAWALMAIAVTTLYEHLSHAYSSPRAILLSLGLTSILALVCGLLMGRSKRVWCRYLCPVGSVFSLLARCAVLQFKVDRGRWDGAPKPLPRAVDCPLLLDVRRLRSNEKCSMCGRCSGHRDAVRLGYRSPGSEIVNLGVADLRNSDVFGVLGVMVGLFFSVSHASPIVRFMTEIAQPPFLPSQTWLAVSLAAAAIAILLWIALYLISGTSVQLAKHLSYGLIPVGAGGMILVAFSYSLELFQRVGLALGAMDHVLGNLIIVGTAGWSIILGAMILRRPGRSWSCVRVACYGAMVVGVTALFVPV